MTKDLLHDLQTLRFWRHFALATFSGMGLLSVAIGMYDVLFPGTIAKHVQPVLGASLVVSLIYGTVRAWPRPIMETYAAPNTVIRVIRGDLFEQRGHLVVGTCDTFDTSVPDIISKPSVQGQYLDRIFNSNVTRLDEQIASALKDVEPIGQILKPGKTVRYPIGTVAVIVENVRKTFLVAYTEMSEDNEARGTPDHVWRSLMSLWDAVAKHSNGGTVSMPVIGGGQSRLSQILPAQDSIRFIALSFMLASRREKVCDELVIVVPDKQYQRLDRLQLQSFLTSLRPS